MQQHAKKSAFEERMTYLEGVRELSPSMYNVVIGAMLVWGFGINYLLCSTLPITKMLSGMENPGTGIILGLVLYFVLALTGGRLVRSESIPVSFLGYNMIVLPIGVLLTICVSGYDPFIVTRATMTTACVTMLMMFVSAMRPAFFENLGPALGIALLSVIVGEAITMLFFGIRGNTVIDYIVVVIMALFIGYDWVRANSVQRTATNAITVAASLYLDIINVFLRILSIMGRRKN